MKKYLLFAALLGAIAFSSVSFLAQAQPETGKVETVIEKALSHTPQDSQTSEAVAPEVTTFMMDAEACEASVAAGRPDIEQGTEEYQNTLISCMNSKGYSAEEVQTHYLAHPSTQEHPAETLEESPVEE